LGLARRIEPEESPVAQDSRWWLKEREDDRASILESTTEEIWKQLANIRQEMFRYGNLYENMPMAWMSSRVLRRRSVSAALAPKLSLNVCKSVVDTYGALITKDKPKVSFVTDRGDWCLQRKAKLLERFTHGIMVAADLYGLAPQIVADSAKFPFGVVKIYAEENATGKKKGKDAQPKIRIDRVLPWELLVDEFDAIYGNPRSWYHLRYVDRLALMAEYPKLANDIKTASGVGFSDASEGAVSVEGSDIVVVIEAWRLARYEGGTDGRHTVICGEVVLVDEVYSHTFSPFVVLHRQTPTTGIYGLSLLKELAPIQLAINRILRDIQRAYQLIVGHWMVENGSSVNTGSIDDRIGSILRYSGTPPTYNAPQPVNGSAQEWLEYLVSSAYALIGISQMASQSEKPAGLNSGKAINAYADVQSQRFEPSYNLYQSWFLQCARQILAVARDISDAHPGFEVKAIGKASMSIIKSSDALLDDSEFELQLFATNAFADDPAARLQQVQDMLAAGLLDPSSAKRLLDMPDLDTEADNENASYNLAMNMIERMLDQGEFVAPEPFMQIGDLPDGGPGARSLCQREYLKAKLGGAPEDRLKLLRTWMVRCNALLQPPPPPVDPRLAAQPGQAGNAATGGAPLLAPPPPPQTPSPPSPVQQEAA
jgi:hypothetical protein